MGVPETAAALCSTGTAMVSNNFTFRAGSFSSMGGPLCEALC